MKELNYCCDCNGIDTSKSCYRHSVITGECTLYKYERDIAYYKTIKPRAKESVSVQLGTLEVMVKEFN